MLSAEKIHAFIESGPGTACTSMARTLPEVAEDGVFAGGIVPGEAEVSQLFRGVAGLYQVGFPILWDKIYPAGLYKRVDIPVAFTRPQRFYPEGHLVDPAFGPGQGSGTGHLPLTLLGNRLPATAKAKDRVWWENRIGTWSHPFFTDHRIGGALIAPFSLYLELATAAVRDLSGSEVLRIRSMNLPQALLLPEEGTVILQTSLEMENPGEARFEVFSREEGQTDRPDWKLHAEALIELT